MSPMPDVLVFSHLRWGFVYQRPNHLLSRCAKDRRVFFVEEPIHAEGEPRLEVERKGGGLHVCVPHVPAETTEGDRLSLMRRWVDELLRDHRVIRPVLWMYTPMALPIASGLTPAAVVYDCMDELSAFHGAHPELQERERALFGHADLVFTGGQSLYESKRRHHHAVHAFPSSVEADHFAQARAELPEPSDQAPIPRPRVGFYGVIDERMDLALLARVADERPNVHLVMIGPIVKIDPASVPRRPNLHWLGPKTYEELPRYLAGWDAAMMPFALNEATRFISPTKTLEYMAAGKPVVSTAIRDVVDPYGSAGVVEIADHEGFAAAIDRALGERDPLRRARADEMVAATSWDRTWQRMSALIGDAVRERAAKRGIVTCSTS